MINDMAKQNCTGCAACCNACPNQAITMKADGEGFLYPEIASNRCTHCSLCDNVCPIKNLRNEDLQELPEAWLAWAKNKALRDQATSGGYFTAIAENFLKSGGFVCGAQYYDVYKVRHVLVDTPEQLKTIGRSKYVQSEIQDVYSEINGLLSEGRKVLFSGTTCQVYGLLSFLKIMKTSTERLFTVDVICHGVPSPLILRKYIEEKERCMNDKVIEIRMREKSHLVDYRSDSNIVLSFESGAVYQENSGTDYFGRLFWGEISARPSCYDCAFKKIGRISDVSIGDCWFSRNLTGDNNVPYDVTLCLVHTEKGRELMRSDRIDRIGVDTIKAIKSNGGMVYRAAPSHPRRDEFFKKLGEGASFNTLTEEIFPVKKVTFLINGIKKAMKTLPIIQLYGKKRFIRESEAEFKRRCNRRICEEAKTKAVL